MLAAAYSIFMVNLVFGILVKTGIIDNSRFRKVHHLLYFLVMASIISAVALAFLMGASNAWYLADMAGMLLGMSLFKGHSRMHWIYATFCCAVYSAILFWH